MGVIPSFAGTRNDYQALQEHGVIISHQIRLVVCSVEVGTVYGGGVSIRHKGQENLVSGALPMMCSRSRGGQGRHLVTFQRVYIYWQVMRVFVGGLEERSLIRYTFENNYSQNALIVHCHNKS